MNWTKGILLIVLVLGVVGQTKITQNQLNYQITGKVTESVTIVPKGVSRQVFPTGGVCTGYMEVLRNGLDQTVGVDFTLALDQITFIPLAGDGDIVKIRCFQ